ncbi:MAG: phosphate starvation-inducible protein PhoH, partial [Parasphingorhabdus sp.]
MVQKTKTGTTENLTKLDLEFEDPQILASLFGEYDRNIVTIESRLGVYIAARGTKLKIEGHEEAVSQASAVLTGIYNRLEQGQEIDTGAVEAIIAMAVDPRIAKVAKQSRPDDGNQKSDVADAPKVMIRTRKKTIFPRSVRQAHYMEALARDDMIFALGPAGT